MNRFVRILPLLVLFLYSLAAVHGSEGVVRATDAANAPIDLGKTSVDEMSLPGTGLLPKATPGCTGGIVYDDNTFENGLQPGDGALNGGFLMRFDPPVNAVAFDQICLCWTQLGNTDTSIIHDVVMFAANGPNGGPGTELDRQSFFTTGIAAFPSVSIFQYALDPGGFQLPGNGQSVYIGPAGIVENANDTIFLCADENGGGMQPMFNTNTGNWSPLELQAPEVDALGIRADAVLGAPPPPPPTGACVPNTTTLCIDDEPGDRRFEIRLLVDSAAGGGFMRQAEVLSLASLGIDRGGILHFGNATNPEVLVKVLDGCNNNGRFWVFASAATNLGFTMTVTDTFAGITRAYTNPDLTQALATTDTQAFATCNL